MSIHRNGDAQKITPRLSSLAFIEFHARSPSSSVDHMGMKFDYFDEIRDIVMGRFYRKENYNTRNNVELENVQL